MVSEGEVRDRLRETEQEMRRLDAEIARLQLLVKLGGADRLAVLDQLSEQMARRRALDAQDRALRWVLLIESGG